MKISETTTTLGTELWIGDAFGGTPEVQLVSWFANCWLLITSYPDKVSTGWNN
jgi:hypothetical protein